MAGGTFDVVVNRTVGTDGDLTVPLTIKYGTAHATDLGTLPSLTLTFLEGETSKTLKFPINDDAINEWRESLELNIDTFATGIFGPPSFGSTTNVLTIGESDGTSTPTYTDTDDDIATVRITKGATFTVFMDDPDGDTKGPIGGIQVAGTDPAKTTLTVSVKKSQTSTDGGTIGVGSVFGSTGVRTLNPSKSSLYDPRHPAPDLA